MEKCFSMKIEDYEIVLPKNNVSFSNGFGIVNAFFNIVEDGEEYNVPLIGVVNQDFETVLDLIPKNRIKNISIMKDSLIFSVQDIYDDSQTFILKREKDELERFACPFVDFLALTDSVIKAVMIVSGTPVELLFNVVTNEQISLLFHKIGPFSYDVKRGDLIAKATYYLPYNDEDNNQIVTYINIKGEVVAPYLDVDQDRMYDSAMDIADIIRSVADDMKKHSR